MSEQVTHNFVNPTLELVYKNIAAAREELIQSMAYVRYDNVTALAEHRGSLVGSDKILKGLIQMDKELINKDDMK